MFSFNLRTTYGHIPGFKFGRIQDVELTERALVKTFPAYVRWFTGLKRILVVAEDQKYGIHRYSYPVEDDEYIHNVLVPYVVPLAQSCLFTTFDSFWHTGGQPLARVLQGWFNANGATGRVVEVKYGVRYVPTYYDWTMRDSGSSTLPNVRVQMSPDGRDVQTWVDHLPYDEMLWLKYDSDNPLEQQRRQWRRE